MEERFEIMYLTRLKRGIRGKEEEVVPHRKR